MTYEKFRKIGVIITFVCPVMIAIVGLSHIVDCIRIPTIIIFTLTFIILHF